MPDCVRVARQTLTLFVWVQILVPQPNASDFSEASFFEVWLSLVERYVRDVEAGGSNPLTSTSKKPSTICTRLFCVLIYRLYGAARLVICSDKRRFGRPKIERIRSRKV